MNVRKLDHSRARAQGITLVEILLAIGLLVILVGFALPSVGNATARAEMKAALENLEYSIGTARNLARITDSSVHLTIASGPGAAEQRVTISQPVRGASKRGPDIPDYVVPESIQLVSEQQQFVFDYKGMVDQPGRIVLVSRADDAVTSELRID